ncbi:MAG: hypothetical protein JWQ90_3 [Hydrocarboniphaga sp.]|uniref:hypothetical protein n=1 Tax=Hydrocarboniphaga sp. TaxID=2033016 RepID=UPI0026212EA0|nr:hypothetical protein [Hydrocarboniphaga sp.]MDB5967553.1 hypothetical protein [Hydrocarboniphaga sp.]
MKNLSARTKLVIATLAGFVVSRAAGYGISLLGITLTGTLWNSYWLPGFLIGFFVTTRLLNPTGAKKALRADAQARAAALALRAAPGAGLVIVYHEGYVGRANGVDISIDGHELVQLKSPRFTAFDAAPGRHTLRAALGGAFNAASPPGETSFDLAAGQAAVFGIKLAMKLSTSDIVLTRIDDPASALAKLKGMQMVAAATMAPGRVA